MAEHGHRILTIQDRSKPNIEGLSTLWEEVASPIFNPTVKSGDPWKQLSEEKRESLMALPTSHVIELLRGHCIPLDYSLTWVSTLGLA